MTYKIQTLTAATSEGVAAINEVMRHSYTAEINRVPAEWARVRVVNDVPVSFIAVDPQRQLEHPGGSIDYAFIWDVATRKEYRNQGHFRAILEDTFAELRANGIALIACHGRAELYRRFGFDVFTHHTGIFLSPELIEQKLGNDLEKDGNKLLVINESECVKDNLLLCSEVRATTLKEAKAALKTAAAVAREKGKSIILFEHPTPSEPGSRYQTYDTLDTPFTTLARACGAEVRVQGADPEGREVDHADWIKVLDAAALLRDALEYLRKPQDKLLPGMICFDTDAGSVTIESTETGVGVSNRARPGTPRVKWPSSALAQLVTGYQPPAVLAALLGTPLSEEQVELLSAIFPTKWRLTRNEDWTFKS